MAKRIVAVVGENGAGKETAYKLTKERVDKIFSGLTVSIHHFSDPINETIDAFNTVLERRGTSFRLERSRDNQQDVSTFIRQLYSQSVFARSLWERVSKDSSDIVFIDGVRRPADALMLRTFPDSVLIYVTAPAEIRYERMKARKEKAGEEMMTWEEFLRQDNAEPEQLIREVAKNADLVFINSGTFEELKSQIRLKLWIEKLNLVS